MSCPFFFRQAMHRNSQIENVLSVGRKRWNEQLWWRRIASQFWLLSFALPLLILQFWVSDPIASLFSPGAFLLLVAQLVLLVIRSSFHFRQILQSQIFLPWLSISFVVTSLLDFAILFCAFLAACGFTLVEPTSAQLAAAGIVSAVWFVSLSIIRSGMGTVTTQFSMPSSSSTDPVSQALRNAKQLPPVIVTHAPLHLEAQVFQLPVVEQKRRIRMIRESLQRSVGVAAMKIAPLAFCWTAMLVFVLIPFMSFVGMSETIRVARESLQAALGSAGLFNSLIGLIRLTAMGTVTSSCVWLSYAVCAVVLSEHMALTPLTASRLGLNADADPAQDLVYSSMYSAQHADDVQRALREGSVAGSSGSSSRGGGVGSSSLGGVDKTVLSHVHVGAGSSNSAASSGASKSLSGNSSTSGNVSSAGGNVSPLAAMLNQGVMTPQRLRMVPLLDALTTTSSADRFRRVHAVKDVFVGASFRPDFRHVLFSDASQFAWRDLFGALTQRIDELTQHLQLRLLSLTDSKGHASHFRTAELLFSRPLSRWSFSAGFTGSGGAVPFSLLLSEVALAVTAAARLVVASRQEDRLGIVNVSRSAPFLLESLLSLQLALDALSGGALLRRRLEAASPALLSAQKLADNSAQLSLALLKTRAPQLNGHLATLPQLSFLSSVVSEAIFAVLLEFYEELYKLHDFRSEHQRLLQAYADLIVD